MIDWTACFPVNESKKVEEFNHLSPSIAEKLTFGFTSSAFLLTSFLHGHTAYAAPNNVIPSAFEPVKALLISLAEPLCYVMFVWGCIEVICKRPASGLDRMKYAAIGFIGVNLIPVIMEVIKASSPS